MGIGSSPDEAFEQAGRALAAVVSDPDHVRPRRSVELRCAAPTLELLLVDWLNALVYEMASGRTLFSKFEVHIDGDRLTGRAWGESIDSARHEPAVEVKGATYTELAVEATDDGVWRARCVVDV